MRRALVVAFLLVWFGVGCSSESGIVEVAGDVPDTVAETQGDEMVAQDTGIPDSEWDFSLPDLGEDLSETVEPDFGGPLPGEAGAPCANGSECNSGFCIQTGDGMQCTIDCVEECPFDWQCLLYTPSLPDQIYLCMPRFVDLCKPCDQNDACWTNGVDAGQACLLYGEAGSFCGGACETDADCPTGYGCEEAEDVTGDVAAQCVLLEGECACKQWYADAGASTTCYVTNEFGTCLGERTCTAGGLTACDAATPAAEACNALDDDCDGDVDEGLSGGECLVINQYGACPGTTMCDNGVESCEGDEPEAEQCDGLDNDCDGNTDEGFEDTDGDGVADCLESDKDGDGVADGQDNCPGTYNPGQEDTDFDGLGNACDQDDDGDKTADSDDCAPLDDEVHPGAEEVCDGKDNDCDYVVDEGFIDTDGDGWKDCIDEDDDNDGTNDGLDCGPLDADVHPGAVEVCDGKDNDCDNTVDEDFPDLDQDGLPDCLDDDDDGDGYVNAEDCKPLNPAINPGAEETCDGQDNDCDLMVDEGFADSDMDSLKDCVDPDDDNDGELDETDCAPTNPAIFPGAPEICDGLDNDCSGAADDGLGEITCGKGACLHTVPACLNGQPVLCDPTEGIAPEVCDNLDNDCDGLTDEDLGSTTCGQGACLHTVANCVDGQEQVCDPTEGAEEEVCDGADNDCDLVVDEGFVDTDADGFKDCIDKDDDNDGELDAFDCAPTDPAVHSGAAEVCNGADDNCNGEVDENIGELACGKGQCFHVVPACVAGVVQSCDPFLGVSEEVCDGVDNDCNGLVDEGLGSTSCGLGLCLHSTPDCVGGQVQECDPLLGAEPEVCDGLDNDCDGAVDDGFGSTTCGVGACLHTVANCFEGQVQECEPLDGATDEVCDGVDNDCDGELDEGFDADGDGIRTCDGDCDDNDPNNWTSCDTCLDGDEDGFYVGCDAYVTLLGGDCNDEDSAVYPDAPLGCDGQDYNCDGLVDNDADEDGFTDEACGGTDCADDNPAIKPDPAGGCALGTSCADIVDNGLAGEDGDYPVDPDGWDAGNPPVTVYCNMTIDGGGWQRIAANRCFGARNNQYVNWSTAFSGTINHYLTVRVSGCLGNGGSSCGSTGIWGSKDEAGCTEPEQNGFYFTTSGNQEIIGNSQVANFSNLEASHVAWFIMNDYCRNSPYLVFDYEQPHPFAAGDYRFWFGEDLHNHTESDNAGTVCVDFFVK